MYEELHSTTAMLQEATKGVEEQWCIESAEAHNEMPVTVGKEIRFMEGDLLDLEAVVETLRLPRYERSGRRGLELPSGKLSDMPALETLEHITRRLNHKAEKVLGLIKTYGLFVFQERWGV